MTNTETVIWGHDVAPFSCGVDTTTARSFAYDASPGIQADGVALLKRGEICSDACGVASHGIEGSA